MEHTGMTESEIIELVARLDMDKMERIAKEHPAFGGRPSAKTAEMMRRTGMRL